jgi:hypothetical protein
MAAARKQKMADKKPTVQRTIFDLDTFTEVTVVKEHAPAPEITSVAQALELLGNDSKRLFALIQGGLEADIKRDAGDSPDGWMYETEDGEMVPFAGTRADMDAVNKLRLTLAKTVFGLDKSMTAEVKQGLKDKAMEMIQNTPAIKEGLKKSAALGGIKSAAV